MRADGHDARRTELHGLLHDGIHLVRLQEALREDEFKRRLRIGGQFLAKLQRYGLRRKCHHLHAAHFARIIHDHDLLAGLGAHDMHEMMCIGSRDGNRFRQAALVEKPSHASSPRLMTMAAQPLSSMTWSMTKPCTIAASVTSATRSSMMPEASRRPPGARCSSSSSKDG